MVDRLGLQTTEHPEYTETNPLVKRLPVFRGRYLPWFPWSTNPKNPGTVPEFYTRFRSFQ